MVSHPPQELHDRIFEFFSDQYHCLRNWGIYLFGEAFAGEKELRNRLGVVWISSLYDTLDGEKRLLPELKMSAIVANTPAFTFYCEQIGQIAVATARFLSRFSRNEQIFMQDFRNQLVHSWQLNPRQPFVVTKYVEGQKYHVGVKMPRDEYRVAVRPYYQNGIEQSLIEITGRIWTLKEPYMHLLYMFAAVPDLLNRIQRDLDAALQNANNTAVTGPVIFDQGTKLAVWDSIQLSEVKKITGRRPQP